MKGMSTLTKGGEHQVRRIEEVIVQDLLHCFVMGTTAAILAIADLKQYQSTTLHPWHALPCQHYLGHHCQNA
jgi:hypothetical protein